MGVGSVKPRSAMPRCKAGWRSKEVKVISCTCSFRGWLIPNGTPFEQFRQEVGDMNGGLAGEAAVVGFKPDGRRTISYFKPSGKSFLRKGFTALFLQIHLPEAVVALDQEQLIHSLALFYDAEAVVTVRLGPEPHEKERDRVRVPDNQNSFIARMLPAHSREEGIHLVLDDGVVVGRDRNAFSFRERQPGHQRPGRAAGIDRGDIRILQP